MPFEPTHVSLVALPDAVLSTLGGVYDVLSSLDLVGEIDDAIPRPSPLQVEIVAESAAPVLLATGIPIAPHRSIREVTATAVVIVPSVVVTEEGWTTGRYPALVEWLEAMHARGAALCSACSGIFLLAETGIFDACEATVHWGYAARFRETFPQVPISPEKALISSGERRELISCGASTSWHDLVLYLLSRRVGAAAAQAVARFYALQWHREGLAPYIGFVPPRRHGDAAVLAMQDWISTHYSVASPVEAMVAGSGLAERTLKRRFTRATGLSPIAYVQRVRVEEAKRRLESTDVPVEEIGWQVGYEDPAFFRRLFKRVTKMTPGAYRGKFRLPAELSGS